ncbi:c-type cytochrome [Salinimicrobium terrae]|uniref:c-type cytochrome n=1 Tax=Salinimicrobium terrae TaxID=470866 RepID=UPI0004048162|nr:cytochrome c [Salinimicrobium terrae]
MKSLFKKSMLFIVGLSVVSCVENSKPNYQYMPNMHETVSYEPYGAYDVFVDEQEAKLPVEGTVSRGWRPFPYEHSPEGFAAAKTELTNPLPYTEETLAAGKALYTIYCALCHGDSGDGKGILVEREKILGIPSYDDVGRAITEGSVYYVQYYGLNAMGSYASQTSIEERWAITHYVMTLKDELEGSPAREFEIPEGAEAGVEAEGENGEDENLMPPVNAEQPMEVKEDDTDEGPVEEIEE